MNYVSKKKLNPGSWQIQIGRRLRARLVQLAKRVLSIGLVVAVSVAALAQSAEEGDEPCSAPEYRQFDFWVGKWDVYPTGTDNLVSHSLIERVYGGCGVRENWMPHSGEGGGSLNIYVPREKAWRQTWIDSRGARVDFSGGWRSGAMVLKGLWADILGPGKDALVRMTYTKAEDGSVRQLGEVSEDSGKTWAPSFDFTYRKAR